MHIDQISVETLLNQRIGNTYALLTAEGDPEVIVSKTLQYLLSPWISPLVCLYMLGDYYSGMMDGVRQGVLEAFSDKGYVGLRTVAAIARAGNTTAAEILTEDKLSKCSPQERLHLRAIANDGAKTAFAWQILIAAEPDGFFLDIDAKYPSRRERDYLMPLTTLLRQEMQPFFTKHRKPNEGKEKGRGLLRVFDGWYNIPLVNLPC